MFWWVVLALVVLALALLWYRVEPGRVVRHRWIRLHSPARAGTGRRGFSGDGGGLGA